MRVFFSQFFPDTEFVASSGKRPRRLCFAHMQKSAGSSVHDFAIRSFRSQPQWREEQYQRIWAADFVDKHIEAIRKGRYRFLYGHFDPTPIFDEFDGLFFTIVRNPLDRVLSLYNFCASMDDETLGGITGVRETGFAEATPSTYAIATDMVSMIDTVRAGLTFSDFIRLPEQLFQGLDSWSDFLAYLPKSGDPAAYAERFQVLGLVEDMQWTLSALAEHMNWETPSKPPRVNRTPKTLVSRSSLTKEDVRIIGRRTEFEGELYRIARERREAA